MTEHAFYNSAEAVPVAMPATAWRSLPGASFARDRSRVLANFARSGGWTFRSIRQADGSPSFTEAEAQVPNTRIHLKSAEGVRPVAGSGLGKIGSDMSDPRLARSAGPGLAGGGRITAMDIYTGHFGLNARPFSLVPDPEFLFWSTEHQHAFAALEYGVITRAPITLITGEVGAGKTTLVHQLLKTVGEGLRIGLVSATHGSPEEMLRWVMQALGQAAPQDVTYPGLVEAFQTYLIEEYARGNRVVLIFDEAQNLCAGALEELRLLTNINSNKDELLQLVLVGQPELRDLAGRPELRQFAQRVAASFHLKAMDGATTRAYIAHRLRVAGVRTSLFSEAAAELIQQATGGIPRRVNQLCDLAMVYAFSNNQQKVIRFTVQQVLDDGTFFGASLPAQMPFPIAAE